MATRLTHETNVSVTSQEAQEVMAYFEQRRHEGERMSAHDIAEALAVPVSEVEAVIAQLRGRSFGAAQQAIPRQKNPKKHRGLIFIAVTVWLGVFGGAMGLAYRSGQMNGFNRYGGTYLYGQTPIRIGNGRVVIDTDSHPERLIPAGVTVSFRGYQVTGTGATATSTSEEAIESVFRSIVEKVAGRHDDYNSPNSIDRRALGIALTTGQIGTLGSVLRFDEFEISRGDQKQTLKIPTALTSDYSAREVIGEEQDRRFAVLANQAVRMGKPAKNP